jgi:hypothetical protein
VDGIWPARGVRPSTTAEAREAQTVEPVTTTTANQPSDIAAGVPRWPAVVALLTVGVLLSLVSSRLTLGPSWVPLAVVLVLVVPLLLASQRNLHGKRRTLGMIGLATVTIAVAASSIFLVQQVVYGELEPTSLLTGAAAIWVANLLTFSIWYWEIDGGGPAMRRRDGHVSTDFLFPQMQVGDGDTHGWWPSFIDYMFVAFNASSAFSPTDTLILSHRAKVLMMAQSLIAIVTVVVLAARAINTLR